MRLVYMTHLERNAEGNPHDQPSSNEMITQTCRTRALSLSPFTLVDADKQPQELIKFLDTVATILTYKPKAYQVLQTAIHTGDSILDAGCGSGYDFNTLAQMVGETGKVVGVDSSKKMLAEAQKRCQEFGLSVVQLTHADLHTLPFSADAFDGCRVDRVLQHVENPTRVLENLTRVLKPNGILVASEPDWEAWSIHPNGDTTRKIVEFKREHNIRNGHIARELPGLLKRLGYDNVQVIPVIDTITDIARFGEFTNLDKFLGIMQYANAISEEEAHHWLDTLEQSYQEGKFVSFYTTSIVSGRKGN